MTDSDDIGPVSKGEFLVQAALLEGFLLLLAVAGGWLTSIQPFAQIDFNWRDTGLGVVATIPLLCLLALVMLVPTRGLQEIRTFLARSIGPLLQQCNLFDLLLLALLAGVCEEILFRGFLYPWISQWNSFLGIMLPSLLFGLVHPVSTLYVLLAAFMGLYFTGLLSADESPNLLIPIVTHAFYDFIAFLIVIRDFRADRQRQADSAASTDQPPADL